MTISSSETIRQKIHGLKFGLITGQGVKIRKESDLVNQQFQALREFIQTKFSVIKPSRDNTVSAVRRMYRRIGWEPTKYRPSSEAMIRRFIKDIGLYRINNVVDLGNVASTHYHLPMGLYDLDKISGDIIADVGREEETYQGISKGLIHAEGKLILRDQHGIFGNPTTDSKRTRITKDTKNILVLFFCPPEIQNSYIENVLDFLTELYHTECPGSQYFREIIEF